MLLYILKVGLAAAIIVTVTELSKRRAWWGALLASLPLISILSMIWLYVDTDDVARVSAFAWGVLWLVLPSLALFVVLPVLLRAGWGFWPGLIAGCVATAGLYLLELWLLPRIGVQL